MSAAGDERPTGAFASVAIPVPVHRTFTYEVPEGLAPDMRTGARVRVPFGRRAVVGTVVEWPADPPEADVEVRPIAARLDRVPEPTSEMLELAKFVADYYLCSWGEAIEATLPPAPAGGARGERGVRRTAGSDPERQPARAHARRALLARLPDDGAAVAIETLSPAERRLLPALRREGLVEVVESDPEDAPPPAVVEPRDRSRVTPTAEQSEALTALLPALEAARFAPFVLVGATGSGKTEVYLRAAEAALSAGRGVLYLVPEIGLTPLLMSRLRGRFGAEVEVLHSALPRAERLRAWHRIRSGACRFAVGTRSAVFAPVHDLALIVVDEEHDGSYKQEETPRYNGRDLAVLRARENDAVVVLGSATPSLESFQHATAGRYHLIRLGARVLSRPLPKVEVVDMRREYQEGGEIRPVSAELLGELERTLGRGDQALVLRNRRGWATALFCPKCGNRIECKRCSLTLTWHRRERRLRCHACGFERTAPRACPHCGHDELKHVGEGSERIEDELRVALPGARIERMDRDTVRRKGAHEAMLRRFDRREIDILVGTQMIAKGHDFPAVTLVGVLSADQSLGLPDFRAGERTFQLLTQVAGRAGRGERPGKVVLQAFDPRHEILKIAIAQDYERFFEREIEYRRALRYPPFTAVVHVIVHDPDLGRCGEWADQVAAAIRAQSRGRLIVTGPGPAPIERVRDRYRYQILVRSAGRRRLVESVREALRAIEGEVPRRALMVDVDPYSLL